MYKRQICVFGSVGGRTQVRRKELADASSAYADYSILTSDNPDNEPPEDVIRDIAAHMAPGAPYTLSLIHILHRTFRWFSYPTRQRQTYRAAWQLSLIHI